MEKSLLAINPTCSTEYLVKSLNSHGLNVVAFFTHTELSSYAGDVLTSTLFKKIIITTGDESADLSALKINCKQFNIIEGFIGSEADVGYGDKVLKILFPQTANNPVTSKLRYDKYAMCERLHELDIGAPIQQILNTKDPLDISIPYPLIAKRSHGSAASVGVAKIHSPKELIAYTKTDYKPLFYHSDDIILQEELIGDEYFVNTASFANRHLTSAIFSCKKFIYQNQFAYRSIDLLEHGPIHRQADRYVQQCLDALGVRSGLAHTEIILTNDGFKLVELNPRIAGLHGLICRAAHLKYGYDQIDLYVAMIMKQKVSPTTANKSYRIFLMNNFGFNYTIFNTNLIEKIPSLVSYQIMQPLDAAADDDVSLINIPALMLLGHSDKKQIEADTQRLVEMETSGECFL